MVIDISLLKHSLEKCAVYPFDNNLGLEFLREILSRSPLESYLFDLKNVLKQFPCK